MAKKTILALLLFSHQSVGFSTSLSVQKFKGFDALRDKIYTSIVSAKKRVWLLTNFISDFDVSMAMYVAKSHRRDVRVLLNEKRLEEFLSQYTYLLAHDIKTKTSPNVSKVSYLFCDDKLYRFDSDLDFLTSNESFVFVEEHKAEKQRLEELFASYFAIQDSGHIAYDYSNKIYKQPIYIPNRLPKKTIAEIREGS